MLAANVIERCVLVKGTNGVHLGEGKRACGFQPVLHGPPQ